MNQSMQDTYIMGTPLLAVAVGGALLSTGQETTDFIEGRDGPCVVVA